MLAAFAAPLISSGLQMQPSTYSRAVGRSSHSLFSGRGFFISAAFVGNLGWDPLGLATAESTSSSHDPPPHTHARSSPLAPPILP